MATIGLNWDNTAVNASANATGQRASKRVKSVGGAYSTADFTPANDMAKTENSATTLVDPNKVYQFKVEALCAIGGPTINGNGIQEGIIFECIGGNSLGIGNPGEIVFRLTGFDVSVPDINFVKFELWDATNTTQILFTASYASAPLIQHTFSGLTPGETYTVRAYYGAMVNGVQTWDTVGCSYTGLVAASVNQNVEIHNTSLDVNITNVTLDGVALPTTPDPYAAPGDNSSHILANDGTVDAYVEWTTAIPGQNIYLQDTNNLVLACEGIAASGNATWIGVDMTGPFPLRIYVGDGACV